MSTKTDRRQFWREFIALYRNLPSLWKVKSEEYRNRSLKSRSYNILINKMKQVDPGADRDAVVRKINSMRSNFRREMNRLKTPEATNQVPNLWYFQDLEFLTDQDHTSFESYEPFHEEDVYIEPAQDSSSTIQIKQEGIDWMPVLTELTADLPKASDNENLPTSTSPQSTSKVVSSKRKSSEQEKLVPAKRPTQLRTEPTNQTIDTEIDFDLAGKKYASDLRTITPTQRIFVEKMLSDVLFYGKLGKLNENSSFQVGSGSINPNIYQKAIEARINSKVPERPKEKDQSWELDSYSQQINEIIVCKPLPDAESSDDGDMN